GHERDYKWAAKRKLDATLPLDKAADAHGAGEAALAVFRATNLLSPFEKTRMQAVLRGPYADEFVRSAAAFTLGDVPGALQRMARALKADDADKWTVVTYLPFLWDPAEHMFLKPNVTCDFADRVGHPFAHECTPRLEYNVYRSLVDMTNKTAHEVRDLAPADNIDIQSFVWVLG